MSGEKRRAKEVQAHDERVIKGNFYIREFEKSYNELLGHSVMKTKADGFCFFHAVYMQLQLTASYNVWEIALSLLQWMNYRRCEWAAFLDDEFEEERKDNLRDNKILKEVERRCGSLEDFQACLYILDRCAGILDRDWGYKRLYSDGLLIEQFATYMGINILILRCDGVGRVDIIKGCEPHEDQKSVLKFAHYPDRPEHFNAICGTNPDDYALIRQRIQDRIMDTRRSVSWNLSRADLQLIAHEVLPETQREDDVDASDTSDCDTDEETNKRPNKKNANNAETAPTRWIPKTMDLAKSPHPRALQELRFIKLAEEWHPWVTVPEYIAGQTTTLNVLDDAVALPLKHCVWKNCTWCGNSNQERWAHVKEKHWSETLESAVNYYPEKLPHCMRLETVLGQVAGLLVRKSAPLVCAAIDRRCLYSLSKAIGNEDSVQSLICFSCACSHAYVPSLGGCRIKFRKAIDGKQSTLFGIPEKKVLEMFGLKTYLQKFGKRTCDGAVTDLSTSPFAEELREWEIGIWMGSGGHYDRLLGCSEDRICKNHKRGMDEFCKNCEIPLCEECEKSLFATNGPELPNIALANDMWIGYGSSYMYEMKATYLEVLAASPCCISLICFVLQASREEDTANERASKRHKPLYRNVFHESAFLQEQKTAARGNATMFLMPLGDVLVELKRMEKENNVVLPRSSEEIKNVVKVILKSAGKLPASLITAATIRRDVVIRLIEEEKKRGHPLYHNLDLAEVRAKAEKEFPTEGALPGIEQQRPHDDSLDKILVQKSASPHAVATKIDEVFTDVRPSVIVLEKSGQDERDEIQTQLSCWENIAKQMYGHNMTITTGSTMQSTFVSDFLPKAHPFVHKSVLACPDHGDKLTLRALKQNPLVPLQDFTRCTNRRIEHQFRGSWSYGYTTWNMNFRERLNSSRTVYAVGRKNTGEADDINPDSISKACEQIVSALKGHYTTPDGNSQPVQGDITKALYCSGIGPIARRLLYNVSAICQDIPGTQEIRRLARSMTKSYVITYGLPTFITWTVDEQHSAIFLRLFRLRQTDPAITKGDTNLKKWAERLQPPLTDWTDKKKEEFPPYEVRRKIMTNSALSANDGFQVHTRLLFKHAFGVRICLKCPNCHCSSRGQEDSFCCDAEGCSSELEGGSIGRVLAIIGTSEFQKKRDEHIHLEAIVECSHTATSLHEIADLLTQGFTNIVEQHKRYVNHVCVQRYMDETLDPELQRIAAESTWPGHRECTSLASLPKYCGYYPHSNLGIKDLQAEGRTWKKFYHADLDKVIEKRQEHIHLKDSSGVRQPLTACRSRTNPKICKHGFDKNHLICKEARVLCSGLAKELHFSTSGRRNAIGSIEAARGSGSVNGCMPVITVAGRNNNDIKVPYRLPILQCTHETACKENCWANTKTDAIIDAVEISQSAQVGYHCDYGNKRQPVGMHEANEWKKGHQELSKSLKYDTVPYATRRHAQRIISDCFARGILRTPNESSKLNDIATHADPADAEVNPLLLIS